MTTAPEAPGAPCGAPAVAVGRQGRGEAPLALPPSDIGIPGSPWTPVRGNVHGETGDSQTGFILKASGTPGGRTDAGEPLLAAPQERAGLPGPRDHTGPSPARLPELRRALATRGLPSEVFLRAVGSANTHEETRPEWLCAIPRGEEYSRRVWGGL